jgi:hypothetical protein
MSRGSHAPARFSDEWVDSLGESLKDQSYRPESKSVRVSGTSYDSLIAVLAIASKCSPDTIRKVADELFDMLAKEPPIATTSR